MHRPDWTYGFFYQRWSRLLHRFDLHHTTRIGPMDDGAIIHKCTWCGVGRTEVPMHVIEAQMRAAALPSQQQDEGEGRAGEPSDDDIYNGHGMEGGIAYTQPTEGENA